MSEKAIKKADRADIEIDADTTASAVESIVIRGDISAMEPGAKARFYIQMCRSLGLNPATHPFAILRLQGREIMYPTRVATDQLAAIHRLNREIVDGPKVIDLAGTKLVYAVCRATHPNGRVETAVSTVPLSDVAQVMMRCETKAKRRATLSILGLGMLDESEIESIPASERQAMPRIDLSAADAAEGTTPGAVEETPTATAEGAASVSDDGSLLPAQAAAIYLDHYEEQGQEERAAAWRHLAAKCGGTAALERAVGATLEGYALKAKSVDELDTVARMAKLLLKGGTDPFKSFGKIYRQKKGVLEPPPEDPGPKGGKPAAGATPAEDDPEREHIQAEGNGAAAQASAETLPMAVLNEVKTCNGPDHVARHYAAHVGDLAEGLRGRYRAWCEQYLGGRYAKHVAKQPGGAAGMLDEAVEKRAAKLAAEAAAEADEKAA